MALWRALGICPGDVVAFTGGGGKTSTARRVAQELRAAGRPVIFTTTTKIMPAPDMRLVLTDRDPPEAVQQALAAGLNVCLAAGVEPETGKLLGLTAQQVAELRGLGAGAVLVEADGSKMLPLKAPAAHEPVIPAVTDLVVPVAGASALGRRILPGEVHRPDRVAAAAGARTGDAVTPATVAAALVACMAGAPPGARVVPALAQADLPDAAAGLHETAGLLVGRHGIGRVVLAAPATEQPVRAVRGDIAAVVLAGGASRRFAGRKLLHPWGDRTVLEASLQAPLRAGLAAVAVVTGAYHDDLAPLLERYPVQVVPNPDWAEGMAASMRAGLHAVAGASAVLICLADQPNLPPAVLQALAESFRRTGARIIAPTAGGERHNPVLFDRSLIPELLAVHGDEGGRTVLQRHRSELRLVDFPEPALFHDIDERSDLPPTPPT